MRVSDDTLALRNVSLRYSSLRDAEATIHFVTRRSGDLRNAALLEEGVILRAKREGVSWSHSGEKEDWGASSWR